MGSNLLIGGFVPFTAIDYPDHLSAVVFCQGCPWKCRYCHNPQLQPFTSKKLSMTWGEVLEFLKHRKKLLDSLVFSGGEPTLQPALLNAICDVKELGFKVGLHTCGSAPNHLKKALPLVDWIGMDVKSPFKNYEKITNIKNSEKNAIASIRLVIESKISHEFRTTIHSSLLTRENILTIAKTLSTMGAKNFALQKFQPHGCNDQDLISTNPPFNFDKKLSQEINLLFDSFIIR